MLQPSGLHPILTAVTKPQIRSGSTPARPIPTRLQNRLRPHIPATQLGRESIPAQREPLTARLRAQPLTSSMKPKDPVDAADRSEPADAARARTITRTPSDPIDQTNQNGESRDALIWYIQQAARVPLLTLEEEVQLAARIKLGDELARDHMIRANLRLVIKMARDHEHRGLPLLDLISEGNLGLMKAVERFDPSKGAKFSTYGSWWIKQSMRRAIAKDSRTIRLPLHLSGKLLLLRKASHHLEELLGRVPSEDELAAELDTTAQKISFWQRSSALTCSLDAPMGEDDSPRLGETVADEQALTPYEQLATAGAHQMLRGFLNLLNPRELQILKERFALDGGPERTLEELGQRFGVTRERIRQVQNLALDKLREAISRLESLPLLQTPTAG